MMRVQTVTHRHLFALLLYVVVTLVMSWPAGSQLLTHVAGQGGDPWQTMWRFNHTYDLWQEARVEGRTLNLLGNEFLGGGEPRLVNLSVWPWLWLHALVGQPLTYNIIWLISFVASGLTMYALVWWLLQQPQRNDAVVVTVEQRWWAALLSGLVYAFSAYHVAHALGHFGALQVQWIPLLLLLLLLLLQRPTIGRAILFSIVGLIQLWTEHHYALWLFIAGLILVIRNWRQLRRTWRGKNSWSLGFVAVILGGIGIASFWPTIQLAAAPENILDLGIDQTTRFSADLFSFVVPAPFHSLWGGLFAALFSKHFTGNIAEATHYLGIVPLLFVIFFRQRIPYRQFRLWLTVAVVFFFIALGPYLHVIGNVPGIPLPYWLVKDLPVFSSLRAVARASVLVVAALSILVGWTAATHIKRRGVALTLAVAILLEFVWWPMTMQGVYVSRVYAAIAAAPGRAIIEIPAGTNYTTASRSLYASHKHGKDVIGNIALERALDSAVFEEIRSLPALRQLLYLRTTHLRADRPDFFDQQLPETLLDTLRWLDVHTIVVHPDSLTALQLSAVRQFLEQDVGITAQVYDDAILYAIPSELLLRGDGIFIARDGRWQHVGYDEERGHTFAQVAASASVTLYNADNNPRLITLQFSIAPESHGEFDIAGTILDSATYVRQPGELVSIPLTIPPGTATITVTNKGAANLILMDPNFEVH